MATLYGMGSPNVIKVIILLEELGMDYDIVRVDVFSGAQKEPWFTSLNPNGRVPVLAIDTAEGPVVLAESGAILLYLADLAGRFNGGGQAERAQVLQWLMFQMSGPGPIFGQAIHFTQVARDPGYAQVRFTVEMRRLLDVIDRRLAQAPFLAGDHFTIADIALWPWIETIARFFQDETNGAATVQWFDTVGRRPAVIAAQEKAAALRKEDRFAMQSASRDQLDRYFGRNAAP